MEPPTLAELHALLARRELGPLHLLGLDACATHAQVAHAFRDLVARIHPALFPDDVERHRAATDLFTAAQQAYRALRAAPREPRDMAVGSSPHLSVPRRR